MFRRRRRSATRWSRAGVLTEIRRIYKGWGYAPAHTHRPALGGKMKCWWSMVMERFAEMKIDIELHRGVENGNEWDGRPTAGRSCRRNKKWTGEQQWTIREGAWKRGSRRRREEEKERNKYRKKVREGGQRRGEKGQGEVEWEGVGGETRNSFTLEA